jgi:integrase
VTWSGGIIESGMIAAPKSKTEAGTGRTISLTRRACAALSLWFSRFPDAGPDTFVFPRHLVGVLGNKRMPHFHSVDLHRPMGEWKKAWKGVCTTAEVRYRWRDLRHTLITRLAENPAVSKQTIMALAGHVSRARLARYSHIRTQAKQAAIATLDEAREAGFGVDFKEISPQNPPQSNDESKLLPN